MEQENNVKYTYLSPGTSQGTDDRFDASGGT